MRGAPRRPKGSKEQAVDSARVYNYEKAADLINKELINKKVDLSD